MKVPTIAPARMSVGKCLPEKYLKSPVVVASEIEPIQTNLFAFSSELISEKIVEKKTADANEVEVCPEKNDFFVSASSFSDNSTELL